MRKVKAKLYGGPFDGDAAIVDSEPPRIWVQPCSACHGRKCSGTEWFEAWVRGAEVYDRDDGGEPEPGIDLRYKWANLKDPGPFEEFELYTPRDVDRILEREPVPS